MTDQLPEDIEALIADATEPETMPDTREIEKTLLTGLFTTPQARAKILADTRPDDYYFDLHRRLAAAIYPELALDHHIDRVTLGRGLPAVDQTDSKKVKERDDLLNLVETLRAVATDNQAAPDLGKIDAYLTIFVEEAKRRQASEAVRKIGDALDAGKAAPAEAFAKALEVITDGEAARRLIGAFKSEAEDWPPYFAALEASQDESHKFLGLNTGFDHLNNVANGLTEGLFVLGAAPSTGKTTWAKQLGDQVAELNPRAAVLFVSFEQSREELRVKTLSRLSGVENRDILRGRLDVTSPGWARVKKASADFLAKTAGRVYILEGDKTTTPDRIRLAGIQVQRATQAEGLLIIVDYLQVIPTTEDYRDPRFRVDAVVSDLRRVARDLGASVLTISSLNRASYGNDAGMSAFKETGGIEYGADLGAILIPDIDPNTKKPQKGSSTIQGVDRAYIAVNLAVLKNRNGERAKIGFHFYPAISFFNEKTKASLSDDPWETAMNPS